MGGICATEPSQSNRCRELLCVLAAVFFVAGCQHLRRDVGDSLRPTSVVRFEPTGVPATEQCWRDICGREYPLLFKQQFDYHRACVTVVLKPKMRHFSGTLIGKGLKPHFAYILLLVGKPQQRYSEAGDDHANQLLGTVGGLRRSAPSGSREKDAPRPSQGWLLFDYFVTDAQGNAACRFFLRGSFSKLCRVDEQTGASKRRAHIDTLPRKITVREAGPAGYSLDGAASQDVYLYLRNRFGKRMDRPMRLPPARYRVLLVIAEQPLDGDGRPWRAVMQCDVDFEIVG